MCIDTINIVLKYMKHPILLHYNTYLVYLAVSVNQRATSKYNLLYFT
jgi:hypothetical protein